MAKTILVVPVVVGLMACQSAIAAEYKNSVGLGVGMAPDYEGSEDYDAVPIAYARFSLDDGDYVMLNGNKLKWNFVNDKIEFGPLLQYRLERDDVDNDEVDRMKDVDSAIEAGFFLTGVFGDWRANAEFAADISDEHDGYLVTIGGDYNMKVSDDLKMKLGVSTTYASDDYMETYFQVDATNRGTSILPAYEADDSEFKDITFYLTANYSINDNWSIMGNLSYTNLTGDAEDSPIVDDEGDDGQFFAGVTAVYHF